MKILGVFLNPEIRTGGHKRYLYFLQLLADKGNDVYLVKNSKLDYNFVCCARSGSPLLSSR